MNDMTAYGKSTRKWVSAIMPAWRIPDDGRDWPLYRIPVSPSEVEGGMWDDVRKGGPNGMHMLVLALSWWIEHASTDVLALSTIEDVAFALGEATRA